MDKLKYFRVIDLIDEDIIEEAEIKTTAPTDTDSESNITVSGTERYKRISWHRLAAVASAVLLIAGIGAGGALMLRNRPPVLVESVETTTEDTTDNTGIKAGGKGGENSSSEGTTDKATTAAVKTSEPKQKESNDISSPTEAENDGNDTEENTKNPREENNEPEERENATTAAKTTQLPVLRTTVTKAQTPTNPPKVTTATKVLPPPEYFTTEPVTERPTPEHDPGYIPYLTWNPEDGDWLMNTLSGLSYTPFSYQGGRPPEGYINGSDGNAYALCFSERWVRRNLSEQAYMPDEIFNYFDGSSRVYYPLY